MFSALFEISEVTFQMAGFIDGKSSQHAQVFTTLR